MNDVAPDRVCVRTLSKRQQDRGSVHIMCGRHRSSSTSCVDVSRSVSTPCLSLCKGHFAGQHRWRRWKQTSRGLLVMKYSRGESRLFATGYLKDVELFTEFRGDDITAAVCSDTALRQQVRAIRCKREQNRTADHSGVAPVLRYWAESEQDESLCFKPNTQQQTREKSKNTVKRVLNKQ